LALRARYSGAVVDLGTGDGRFVLATAEKHPDCLVIGIDADAASMAEASRRAARSPKRGGLPNALFIMAAAEALPAELCGLAGALTIHFPWGSLLRGLLSADPTVVSGISAVAQPGATLTVLLSVTPRDGVAGLDSLDECTFTALAPAYDACGLRLVEARPAMADDITRAHSTWAKRLQAGSSRAAWYVRFLRRTPCGSEP
jgi:16S rRNA (adenine(1408)-N(1))-methyltransferase